MRNLIFFILSITISTLTFGQEYPYKLKGYLAVKGGESFTYELQLKDSTNNTMSGYAYTYLQKNKDVKAEIFATIDRANKKISIYEKNIIHNNGFTSKAIICLVTAELEYSKSEEALTGKLHTKTAGSGALPCTDGSIVFSNQLEINQLFNGITLEANIQEPTNKEDIKTITPKKVIVIDQTHIQDSIRKVQYNERYNTTKTKPAEITQGKDQTYTWLSDKVILEVWDGNNEDGDKIDIELNGQKVLSNYTLRNKKHTITLDISSSELNLINIVALNEGGDPPNTAQIRIIDKDISYDIVAYNHAEKKATIKIKRQLSIQ